MLPFAGPSFKHDLPKLQKQLQIHQETQSTRARPTKTSKPNPNSPRNQSPNYFFTRPTSEPGLPKLQQQLQIHQEVQPEADLPKLQKQLCEANQGPNSLTTQKLNPRITSPTYEPNMPHLQKQLQTSSTPTYKPDIPKLRKQLQTTPEWNLTCVLQGQPAPPINSILNMGNQQHLLQQKYEGAFRVLQTIDLQASAGNIGSTPLCKDLAALATSVYTCKGFPAQLNPSDHQTSGSRSNRSRAIEAATTVCISPTISCRPNCGSGAGCPTRIITTSRQLHGGSNKVQA